MKPKILHIGVGFLGNSVIRLLKEKGYEVELYSRSFGQDITDRKQLEEAIARNDYIIQNAA
ncbi:MAG: hypothetical protein Q7K21_06125, partial [Elusimicrobiota bacterium]|nr:hypothetical protein [Elusimicrobiota bacterium]